MSKYLADIVFKKIFGEHPKLLKSFLKMNQFLLDTPDSESPPSR